jgi:hypothetical protein
MLLQESVPERQAQTATWTLALQTVLIVSLQSELL